MHKPFLFMVALLCVGLFSRFGVNTAKNTYLVLNDEKLSFTPRKFYIADVADKRKNPTPVASLIARDKGQATAIDFEHGAVDAIRNFLKNNLHRDTSLSPVLMTINELKLTESQTRQGTINGDLKIVFAFSSQLSYQNKHLVNYTGEIHYHRSINSPPGAELRLRQAIVGSIAYFNTWMNKQKPSKPDIQAQ